MKDALGSYIKEEFGKLNSSTQVTIVVVLLLQAVIVFAVSFVLADVIAGAAGAAISSVAFIITIFILSGAINQTQERVSKKAGAMARQELDDLRRANKRANALQDMASTMRATLSFEQVMDQALDVSSLAFEEMGLNQQALVGAVLLFDGAELIPVATRRFLGSDDEKRIQGRQGILGDALTNAEPTITNNPKEDPELRTYLALQSCVTVICIPLRAGFQIFGAMLLGSDTAVEFEEAHMDLFNAVADQAVIALQNAQLFQTLEREKARLIHADEDARKELARDLHDGPTQTIAAIAMRVNFIRSLIAKNPNQAVVELEKVEELAKQTSKEIRGLLFALRPLVLETQGLAKAIETVISRIKETDGLNIRLVGGEHADLLTDQAQTVIFSIVEEALGNARKYSQANLTEVRMWREENLFVIQVKDDGVGFDVQDVNRDYSSRGSLGMVNMRERAERIDGSLRLESAPGQGTTVTLVVPLNKHGRRASSR